MIIDDLHLVSVAVAPDKANSEAVVDANAVLSPAVCPQSFEAVARWNPQIVNRCREMELSELASRYSMQVRWDSSAPAGLPKLLRMTVFEAYDQ